MPMAMDLDTSTSVFRLHFFFIYFWFSGVVGLGYWKRRGTDSVCPNTGKVKSPAEMPYLAFIARLYLGIEATSCQAERNFSALSHLIGHLRCNMLSSKVERMMFIRLNRHLVAEVRELDAAVARARAAATRTAQSSKAAQENRANQTVDLSLG